jgi:hypothetical protein
LLPRFESDAAQRCQADGSERRRDRRAPVNRIGS